MENINKTNDWFAARLLNDDKDPAALLVEGINPTNSSLQTPEFYKGKAKVQEAFKKDDGSFDNDTFNKFYDQISKEYEYLSAVDSENFIYDAYEKSNSNFITDFGRIEDKKTQAMLIANPLDQSKGLTSFNEWSEPEISNREAAQTNQYYDPETGKWSEKTLNELGAFGLFGEEGLVYATWDEDGTHIDPMTKQEVLHKKGEWKTDEFGNYYAEKAGNKENLNKQFVTWSEVLTEDGSAWNKVDIFDSDDLNQNVPKAVFRAAATVGALMIPYVGAGIGYTTAAINLARVLPQITKTFASLFSEDVKFDKLNKWDNYMRKFSRSTSDYSQEHTFSLENIIDMATDSFVQLRQQKWIAELPERLGIMKPVEKSLKEADTINLLKLLGTKDEKLLNNRELREALAKASPIYRKMSDYEKTAKKISVAVSRGYLIATSTEDTYNMARSYGFDQQTSSMIALGTYVGIGTLFQTDYFRGMLSNTPDYELQRDVKILVKSYLENNAKTMAGDLAKSTTTEAKANLFKSWGNKIVNFINNHISDVKSGRFGIVAGAINEATEEVAEEVAQDVAFQIGKGWASLKGLFTGKDYTNEYSYLSTDPLSRYATAFFGGALGGAIFKMSDRFLLDKAAYANWRKMLGDNSEISKQFVTLVSQNKKDLILKEIDRLQKTPMISTNLSAYNTSVVAENESESQNAILFGSLRKAVNDLDTFLSNNNLKIDYDQFGDIELLRGVRAAWINSKGLSDSLFQDYLSRTNEISGIFAELQELRSQKVPNMESSEEASLDKKINQLQEIIDIKINQVRNLMQGKDDSYIGRLMLETNKDILNAITPTTKEAWAQNLYGKSFDDLPLSLQDKINNQLKATSDSGQLEINYMAAWDLYKKLSSNHSTVSALENLNNLASTFSEDIYESVVENGEIIKKRYSKDTVTPESIFNDLIWIFNKSFRSYPGATIPVIEHIAYRVLGLKGVLPDLNPEESEIPIFAITGDELTVDNVLDQLENHADEVIQIINNLYDYYIEKYNTIKKEIENNPKEDPNKILAKYAVSKDIIDEDNRMNPAEIYVKFDSVEAIEKARELALSAIKNTKDFKKANSSLIFENTFNTDEVSKIVDSILKEVSPDTIGIEEFIKRENNRVSNLGNQYAIDSVLLNTINNLKAILKLTDAIVSGADKNYRTLLGGVPFGANNFLNQAFLEKGLNIKLAEISPNTINLIKRKLIKYNNILDNYIEKDRINRGEVINQEKKLSLRLMASKIDAINALKNREDIPEFIKDGLFSKISLGDINVTIDDISGDDVYIELGSQLRNKLIEFERTFYNFYNNLSKEGKLDFIKWLSNILNSGKSDLAMDTSEVSTSNKVIFGNQDLYFYFMVASFGNNDAITKAYTEYVKSENKLCPFDSQEEVALSIVKFLLRNNKEEVKLWTEAATVDKHPDFTILNYISKATCSGGTGKTSAIIPIVYNVIKEVSPDKNIIFAANNDTQNQNISESINDANCILISTLLNDAGDEATFREKYQNSLILIDEATNITTDSLSLLDKLCEKYNVSIACLGDVKQHGAVHNFDYQTYLFTTLQLSESKRSATDISRINNEVWEQLFKPNDLGIQNLETRKLPYFKYYEDANTIEGIKFDEALLNQQYIENFIISHNIPNDAKILVFTDNVQELTKGNFTTKYPNITFANNITDIQGAEWDYVITDNDNEVIDDSTKGGQTDNEKAALTLSKIKDIYTLFSRHRHAIVSLRPIHLVNLRGRREEWLVSKDHNTEKSEFPPIISGLTPEAISTFKEFKLKVFDKVTLPEDIATPATEETKPIKVITSVVNTESSDAQATPGFLLKSEFTPEHINLFNISEEDYYKARVILYRALTEPENKEKLIKLLPETLQNGRFRIKVQYSKVADLYNLGNKFRDNKSLNGTHPWIVYSTPVGDITLGMFHNSETSTTGGLSESKASVLVNELAKSATVSEPKYYDIDFNKIKFSRSPNILAIQNKETSDSEYINISYENGQFNVSEKTETNFFKFANTTAAFYFRRGGESIVPVNKILDELEKLNQNYDSFYKLAILSKLYKDPSEYNDILELLDFDRRRSTPDKPVWKPRRTVDLEGRFCSFVYLNDKESSKSITGDLKEKSNIYLQQLKARNAQVSELLQVLTNDSLNENDKKAKIKDILSHKPQWEVSILTYDYDAIESEEEFDNTIAGLQTNEILSTGRNRAAYNNALNHQFTMVLSRIANLILDTKTKWPDSGNRLNKEDIAKIRDHWNKYKEALVNAYSAWAGEPQTEESLLKFLASALTYDIEGNKITEYFIGNGANLLQSEEFSEYLKDIYIKDSSNVGWGSIINKTNGLKYISKDFADIYKGHTFPKLIKDNKLSVQTKGDALSIQKGANLQLKSKVVQLAQIHANIDDNMTIEDFKQSTNEEKKEVKKKIKENKQEPQQNTQEEITIKSLTTLNNNNRKYNRKNTDKLPIIKNFGNIESIIQGLIDSNSQVTNTVLEQLNQILLGNATSINIDNVNHSNDDITSVELINSNLKQNLEIKC